MIHLDTQWIQHGYMLDTYGYSMEISDKIHLEENPFSFGGAAQSVSSHYVT